MAENMEHSKESTTTEPVNSKVESLSTMSPSGLDHLSFQFTVEKLNGKNYREWAQSINLIIDGKWKQGYLTGEKKKPATTDTVHLNRWQSENSMATAWMVNSMIPAIGKTFFFPTHGKGCMGCCTGHVLRH